MRIGLFLAPVMKPDDQVQQVVDAEADGYDAVWFPQIFGGDALTMIALAGARTSRIEMGTSVIPIYPHHPFTLAQQAMTTQAATNGRLTLGIGLSHQPVIEGMWGLSYDKPARYMREYLSVLRPLVSDGNVSFQGDVFRVTGGVQVPGSTPFPVLIAALAPVMLRIAGELADGTVTWMVGHKTLETHIAPSITRHAEAAGRPAPRICVCLPFAVCDDAASARQRASQDFVVYGQLPNYRRMLDKEGAQGPGDVVVVGDEGEVERQLRAFASAGATDFAAAVFPVGDDPAASVARSRALLKGLVGKI
ncbi:MAG: TIGR03564 family F420-dependent LLM class oxidoreductase [Dehalococcoidia bacterium]